jgi:membrane protein required for colicin V production
MLDLLSLLILGGAFYRGFRKGAIVALCALVGVILGVLAALKLSGALGAFLLERGWVTTAWVQLVSYLILFFGVIWLVRLLAKFVEGLVEAVLLGLVNRIIGGLIYVFIGAVCWSALLWLANRAHLLSPEIIAASKAYPYLEPLAPWVFARIGEFVPFAKGVFSSLDTFFDGVNSRLPEHVGTH